MKIKCVKEIEEQSMEKIKSPQLTRHPRGNCCGISLDLKVKLDIRCLVIMLIMLITMQWKVSGVTLPSKMHSIIPIVSSWSISPLWSASNLSLSFRPHLLIP